MNDRGAHRLFEAVALDRPVATDNGAGGKEVGWVEDFTARAEFRYLRGSETVMAARLQGRQPIVAVIPSSEASRQVTSDWRLRDIRRSISYNIRTVVPSDDRRWIEITAESGVAI